jgi:hypothetical protein
MQFRRWFPIRIHCSAFLDVVPIFYGEQIPQLEWQVHTCKVGVGFSANGSH